MVRTFFILFFVPVLPVFAVTQLTVNTNADSLSTAGGSGSAGTGDLRYCLNYILTDQVSGSPDPNGYSISFNSGYTIQLNAKLPIINLYGTSNVDINVGGANTITLENATSKNAGGF